MTPNSVMKKTGDKKKIPKVLDLQKFDQKQFNALMKKRKHDPSLFMATLTTMKVPRKIVEERKLISFLESHLEGQMRFYAMSAILHLERHDQYRHFDESNEKLKEKWIRERLKTMEWEKAMKRGCGRAAEAKLDEKEEIKTPESTVHDEKVVQPEIFSVSIQNVHTEIGSVSQSPETQIGNRSFPTSSELISSDVLNGNVEEEIVVSVGLNNDVMEESQTAEMSASSQLPQNVSVIHNGKDNVNDDSVEIQPDRATPIIDQAAISATDISEPQVSDVTEKQNNDQLLLTNTENVTEPLHQVPSSATEIGHQITTGFNIENDLQNPVCNLTTGIANEQVSLAVNVNPGRTASTDSTSTVRETPSAALPSCQSQTVPFAPDASLTVQPLQIQPSSDSLEENLRAFIENHPATDVAKTISSSLLLKNQEINQLITVSATQANEIYNLKNVLHNIALHLTRLTNEHSELSDNYKKRTTQVDEKLAKCLTKKEIEQLSKKSCNYSWGEARSLNNRIIALEEKSEKQGAALPNCFAVTRNLPTRDQLIAFHVQQNAPTPLNLNQGIPQVGTPASIGQLPTPSPAVSTPTNLSLMNPNNSLALLATQNAQPLTPHQTLTATLTENTLQIGTPASTGQLPTPSPAVSTLVDFPLMNPNNSLALLATQHAQPLNQQSLNMHMNLNQGTHQVGTPASTGQLPTPSPAVPFLEKLPLIDPCTLLSFAGHSNAHLLNQAQTHQSLSSAQRAQSDKVAATPAVHATPNLLPIDPQNLLASLGQQNAPHLNTPGLLEQNQHSQNTPNLNPALAKDLLAYIAQQNSNSFQMNPLQFQPILNGNLNPLTQKINTPAPRPTPTPMSGMQAYVANPFMAGMGLAKPRYVMPQEDFGPRQPRKRANNDANKRQKKKRAE